MVVQRDEVSLIRTVTHTEALQLLMDNRLPYRVCGRQLEMLLHKSVLYVL